MVLHKELRVCNADLPVILVEQKREIARGSSKKLLLDCSNGVLPENAFVKAVDIITQDNKDLPKFKSIEFDAGEFGISTPHLVIKIKTREAV